MGSQTSNDKICQEINNVVVRGHATCNLSANYPVVHPKENMNKEEELMNYLTSNPPDYEEAKKIIESGEVFVDEIIYVRYSGSHLVPLDIVIRDYTQSGLDMVKWLLNHGADPNLNGIMLHHHLTVISNQIITQHSPDIVTVGGLTVAAYRVPLPSNYLEIMLGQFTLLIESGADIPKRPKVYLPEICVIWNHIRKLIVRKLKLIMKSTMLSKEMCIIIAEYVDSYRFRRKKRHDD